MRRGEIYFASLDATQGSEVQKTRPVVLVSNNAAKNLIGERLGLPKSY